MNPANLIPRPAQRPGTALLLQYAYLQLLDLLTTMAFLLAGVEEGNPLARLAMQHMPTPEAGLILIKSLAIGLGLVCWGTGRLKLLRRVNFFYAGLVAWNLLCLILGLAFPRP